MSELADHMRVRHGSTYGETEEEMKRWHDYLHTRDYGGKPGHDHDDLGSASLRDQIVINGSLEFHSETGTEGGYYAIIDHRGVHGKDDLVKGECPWYVGQDVPRGYCPVVDGSYHAHARYEGQFIIGEEDDPERYHLKVLSKPGGDVIFDGNVALRHQRDQYAPDAIDVGGLVVHHIVEGIDMTQDEWAKMFFDELPATLTIKNPRDYVVQRLQRLEDEGPTHMRKS